MRVVDKRFMMPGDIAVRQVWPGVVALHVLPGWLVEKAVTSGLEVACLRLVIRTRGVEIVAIGGGDCGLSVVLVSLVARLC